jgi:hypothetical protein
MSLVNPSTVGVRCSCTVDLLSRRQRPYVFRVSVTGEYPHAVKRTYDITGVNEDAAAMSGMDKFQREMSHPLSIFGAMI